MMEKLKILRCGIVMSAAYVSQGIKGKEDLFKIKLEYQWNNPAGD